MLKKVNRIKRQTDFARVAKYGRKKYSSFFILYSLSVPLTKKYVRFGIVISQKTEKKAVIRNKIRRWLRVDLAQILKNIPTGDYMIVVKKQAVSQNHKTLKKDLLDLLSLKRL
jgi:ribonuclease P protein component